MVTVMTIMIEINFPSTNALLCLALFLCVYLCAILCTVHCFIFPTTTGFITLPVLAATNRHDTQYKNKAPVCFVVLLIATLAAVDAHRTASHTGHDQIHCSTGKAAPLWIGCGGLGIVYRIG